MQEGILWSILDKETVAAGIWTMACCSELDEAIKHTMLVYTELKLSLLQRLVVNELFTIFTQ